MLTVFVIAVVGVAFAGLAVFAAMCVAIRHDDKKGLPAQAPTPMAALTRRFLGMAGSRPVSHSTAERELCTAARGSADQSVGHGRR
jgi:hypothetical protein